MILDNTVQLPNCPVCTSSKIAIIGNITYSQPILFSTQTVSFKIKPKLYKCKNCKSKFISNLVCKDVLIELYRTSNSSEKWQSFDFENDKPRVMIEELKSLLAYDKKILDVGCNTGDFLDFAKKQGCHTYGVEYSKNCQQILEGKGHHCFSSEQEIGETYDVITAFDVIEHVDNVFSFFEFYTQKLKSGGFFILLTGDISCISAMLSGLKWWYFNLPEHIVFPSKKFFRSQSFLELKKIVSVYQSNYFNFPLLSRIKIILNSLIQARQYNGFPVISQDHILVVMQKR